LVNLEKKWPKTPSRQVFRLIVLFFSLLILKNNFEDLAQIGPAEGRGTYLAETARFLAEKIPPAEKFNLAAIYKGEKRWDHNAVDYRYFLESFSGVSAPGWDVLDYREAEALYFISEIGRIDSLTAAVWERETFSARIIESVWELGGDVVIYKLRK